MSKFSNPFLLKNPINQIVEAKRALRDVRMPRKQESLITKTGLVRPIHQQPRERIIEELPEPMPELRHIPEPKLDRRVGRLTQEIREPNEMPEKLLKELTGIKQKTVIGVAGKRINMNDDSPMSKLGCGGKGCVRKRGNEWVILNNKKAGYPVWRSGFKSEADAKKMLSAYHANS